MTDKVGRGWGQRGEGLAEPWLGCWAPRTRLTPFGHTLPTVPGDLAEGGSPAGRRLECDAGGLAGA